MDRSYEKLDIKEWTAVTVVFLIMAVSLSWLFYDSLIPAIVAIPFFPVFVKITKRIKIRKYSEEITEQFLKCLVSVSTALSAGISPENSFAAATSDMEKLYGSKALIVHELGILNMQTGAGTRIDDALFDFARRVNVPEVYDFAVVFSVAKDKGADFGSVISSCVSIMEQRRDAESEARILIRAKQFEQRIICIIPPGIIAYLRISSGNFIGVLYHNPLGIAVMTACLVVFISAVFISEKIGDIRV